MEMYGGGMGGTGDPLSRLDMIQQEIIDLIRQFPGSEQFGQQIIEGIEGIRQMLAVSMSPPSQSMGGADLMI
ncbi:MAG: hypothetical protein L0Y56_13780 [Nitrospira sp.]|nr:hypothetical protein [Nitrospira sp.]